MLRPLPLPQSIRSARWRTTLNYSHRLQDGAEDVQTMRGIQDQWTPVYRRY